MKKDFLILSTFLLLINISVQTLPETKTYDRDGLKFNYPADWTLTDRSSVDTQNLLLSKPGSLVLISIVSPRIVIHNYDQFRQLQVDINDRFIIAVKHGLNTDENTTREESICLNFNGRDITGMRYSGLYKNTPSVCDVFPFVLGDRFINLVYMRSDKDRTFGDAVWKDLISS